MLHLAPERVDMTKAEDFRSRWIAREGEFSVLTPEGAVGFGWETQDLHPAGALGDAGAATAEAGAQFLDHAALLGEVHRLDLHEWLQAGPGATPLPAG